MKIRNWCLTRIVDNEFISCGYISLSIKKEAVFIIGDKNIPQLNVYYKVLVTDNLGHIWYQGIGKTIARERRVNKSHIVFN